MRRQTDGCIDQGQHLLRADYRSHDEEEAVVESYLRWRHGERPIDILGWESCCWQTQKTGGRPPGQVLKLSDRRRHQRCSSLDGCAQWTGRTRISETANLGPE